MKHRFDTILIDLLTIDNYEAYLPNSLSLQVAPFLPPTGSFDDATLRRYIQMIRDFEIEDPKNLRVLRLYFESAPQTLA